MSGVRGARAAALVALLLIAGCKDQKPAHIQWQLPLEAPEDVHGRDASRMALPDWAARKAGEAELVWLDKIDLRRYSMRLELGGEAGQAGPWKVRLLGLAHGLRLSAGEFVDDEGVDNPAAFVEISRGDAPVYRGWLYARFPELFGIDDPGWKVWLKEVIIRPASGSEAEQRTRSSAG